MKKQIYQGLTALLVLATTLANGQDNNRSYDERTNDPRAYRNEDQRDLRAYPNEGPRDFRNDDPQLYRNGDHRALDYQREAYLRRQYETMRRQDENRNRDTDFERYNYGMRTFRRYDDRYLQQAYDNGYVDGKSDAEQAQRKQRNEAYKNFTFGIYAGANSTRFEGEDIKGDKLRGRLGYQFGVFARGGGRLYGQLGAEYLTSSSDFYQRGDGVSLDSIASNINQRYLQIPAYIGVKLAQSRRGTSAVRFQVGAEMATPVGANMNNLNSTTINGLASLGFDAGPFMLGIVYHHGFADAIKDQVNSKRRVLGVNVGLKF